MGQQSRGVVRASPLCDVLLFHLSWNSTGSTGLGFVNKFNIFVNKFLGVAAGDHLEVLPVSDVF